MFSERKLDELTAAIFRALPERGIVDVRYVTSFDASLSVWLVVESDRQRELVAADKNTAASVRAEVRTVIPGVAPDPTVTVQSQETVDRTYGGSWFNAMR